MTDSSGDVELLTGTSIRPQDVAGNSTLTGGTCEYYPAVDGKCAEPRNCADCLLKQSWMAGVCDRYQRICTDANWTDPSLDYRKAQALGLVLPAGNKSDVKQRWFFPAFTTSYCSASDSICAQCRENKFWVSSVDVYNRGYDSRYCVGTNGCVCVSVCEAGTWRVTNHEECLISNDDSEQLGAEENVGRLATYAVVIISCLVVLVIGLCVCTFKPRRRQIPLTRLAEQHEGSHQTLQVEREQSCVGKRSSTVETATAYVSVEDASEDAVVAALKRTT